MLLEINDHKSIEALQREFAGHYPFLKIELFDRPHEALEGSPEKHRLPPWLLLGRARVRHNKGVLEINPMHTAYYIEKLFRNRYGMYVQIYRKGADGWIQTVGSDFVTLKEHNEIGRMAVESGHPRERTEFMEDEY
jgi:hypothetical protein